MKNHVNHTDWLNNHLYLSHKFNKELNDFGIELVSDLQKLSLLDLLNFKTITIARLRNVIVFMFGNNLNFRSLGN
ncbi:hypothetical protein ABIB50_005446 [Mucilaginibacter sp. UYCu711]|jgi:hypothetical protein